MVCEVLHPVRLCLAPTVILHRQPSQRHMDKVAKMALCEQMKNFSAKDAKNQFGKMIDDARLEPVVIEKHGRPVVVVCSVEEFERLSATQVSVERDKRA